MVRETVRRNDSSRLPRAVEAASELSTRSDSSHGRALPASDHVYTALRDIGAPEVTQEDLARLYKGPFADVLGFAAEHIKGRAAVASARHAIQQMRETRGRLKGGQRDTSYDRAQAAAVRLVGAESALKSVQDALNDRQMSNTDLQRRADTLQADMEERRLDLLLLSVLEKKETMRAKRFSEIETLLADLREEVQTRQKHNGMNRDTNMNNLAPPLWTSFYAGNTRDVLASLHAKDVALSQLASRKTGGQKNASEKRLRSAISSATGLPEDDAQTTRAYEACLRRARAQAEASMRYHSPLDIAEKTNADLDMASQRVTEKARELQRLSDSTVALGLSCAHSLQTMSNFDSTTGPALRESLREELATARGYVDALRLSVVHRERAQRAAAPNEVQRSCLSDGKSWEGALADARTLLEKAHETESFLRAASFGGVETDSATLIAELTETQMDSEQRITKLLTRKLEKAAAGDVLVSDVERLIAEVGTVTSLSGSSVLG